MKVPVRSALRAASLAALITALWACAAGPPQAGSAGTAGTSAAPLARVDALIGQAICRSDADCATIAIGALACGGPQAWRPWSRGATDEPALNAAVAEHRSARQREIAQRGEMSTCQLVTDPGAHCAPPGRCQLRTQASSGLR